VRASVDKIAPVGGVQQELDVLRERLAQLEESLAELEVEPAATKGKRRKGAGKRLARR